MTEKQQAIELANRVLDKPYIDPDGDICVLARQFLRTLDSACNLLTNVAQILDVVKQEWGTDWSKWDQEQRDEITKWLVAAAAIREKKEQ